MENQQQETANLKLGSKENQVSVEENKDEEEKRSEYYIDSSLFGKPVDYSFRKVFHLSELKNEPPREFRVGLPKKDSEGKFVSRSLWLNYNQLSNLEDLQTLVGVSFRSLEEISWLDISFNEIKNISEDLLRLKKLKILYLHGNRIKYFMEVAKLKPLVLLRKLTLHGNPIEENSNYRSLVTKTLPQLIDLDFSLVTK